MKIQTYINPKYAERLAQFIGHLASEGVPSEAVCIYEGRNRLYNISVDGILLNIKSFRCPSFPNSYIYRNLRASKARRSYEHAAELLRRGLPTPEPVAWIECSHQGKLKQSYYICLQSPLRHNMRRWEEWPEEEQAKVLPALAKFMRELHTKGILHHDFSPGNVLWDMDEQGKVVFDLLDLNRMTIFDHPLSGKQAFSNFRNINITAPDGPRRLAALYGPLAGMDGDEAGQKGVDVMQADLRRKHRLHSLKKLLP